MLPEITLLTEKETNLKKLPVTGKHAFHAVFKASSTLTDGDSDLFISVPSASLGAQLTGSAQ